MELPDYIAFLKKKKLEDLSHSQGQNSKCVLAIVLKNSRGNI